jgi:hypothetical protein
MPTTVDDVTSIASPRWQAVGLVIDQNRRDLLAKRYGLLQEVVSWFKALELFRQAESDRMIERTPTAADRRYHKTWLATLIAEGERLLTEVRAEGGMPRNKSGIKLSDVVAIIEELYDTQAEWYGGMKPERKTELLSQIFHVPAA